MEGNKDGATQVDSKKKKTQQEKKRKREEKDDQRDKEKIEEETDIENEGKVFTSNKTGGQHYHEVLKEMEYIKRMSSSSLMAMMNGNNGYCGVKLRDRKVNTSMEW